MDAARRSRSEPLVSVVVPSYGRSKLLPDALRSVAAQTHSNVELLVVDDHSPEPVAPVVEGLDLASLEVRCIRHEENRGANAARNTGIEAASGEYIAFLDDDDYWLEEKLERQIETFREADENVGAVFTGVRAVDGDGRTTNVRLPTTADGTFLERLIRGDPFGPFSTVMVRADVVERAGTLDERFPSWQDREWYFRLARHCEFASIPEPLVVRLFSDQEQISDDFESKRDVTYPLFLETVLPFPPEYRHLEDEFVAKVTQLLGRVGLSTGHRWDAVRYLLRSLWYDPTVPGTYLYLALALGGDATYVPARSLKRWLNRRRNLLPSD